MAHAPVQFTLQNNKIKLIVQGFPRRPADGSDKQLRMRLSTGHRIEKSNWDDDRQRPTVNFSLGDQHQLEIKLTRMWSYMTTAWSKAQAEGQHTPDRVLELYEQMTGVRKTVAPVSVIDARVSDVLSEIIDKAENEGTANHYRAFLGKVEAFSPKLKVSGLTDSWRDRFFAHCRAQSGFNENGCWACLQKPTNKLINVCKKKGMKLNIATDHRFAFTTPDTDWLDWQDLAKIIAFEPQHRLERSRKKQEDTITLLLAMALTSCRVSDLWKCLLSIEERNGLLSGYYRTTKKCGKTHALCMPLIFRPLADRIQKYGIPARRADQQVNDALKELMSEIGITKDISNHKLRSSFVTNFLPILGESLVCRLFTGHQIGGSGELRVLVGYDKSDGIVKQKQAYRILSSLDPSETAGIRLV